MIEQSRCPAKNKMVHSEKSVEAADIEEFKDVMELENPEPPAQESEPIPDSQVKESNPIDHSSDSLQDLPKMDRKSSTTTRTKRKAAEPKRASASKPKSQKVQETNPTDDRDEDEEEDVSAFHVSSETLRLLNAYTTDFADTLQPFEARDSPFTKTSLGPSAVWFILASTYFPKSTLFRSSDLIKEALLDELRTKDTPRLKAFRKNIVEAVQNCTNWQPGKVQNKDSFEPLLTSLGLSPTLIKEIQEPAIGTEASGRISTLKSRRPIANKRSQISFLQEEVDILRLRCSMTRSITEILKATNSGHVCQVDEDGVPLATNSPAQEIFELVRNIPLRALSKIVDSTHQTNSTQLQQCFDRLGRRLKKAIKRESFFCRHPSLMSGSRQRPPLFLNSVRESSLLYNMVSGFPIERKFFEVMEESMKASSRNQIQRFFSNGELIRTQP